MQNWADFTKIDSNCHLLQKQADLMHYWADFSKIDSNFHLLQKQADLSVIGLNCQLM